MTLILQNFHKKINKTLFVIFKYFIIQRVRYELLNIIYIFFIL